MHVWVIGSGGLLGHEIARQGRHTERAAPSSVQMYSPGKVPWLEEREAISVLTCQIQHFANAVGSEPWAIVWAAGTAVVASDDTRTSSELSIFTALAESVATTLPPYVGTFFVTSSAGGVYAASSGRPFSVDSPVAPISAYGELKLAQERAAIEHCSDMCSVLIGRFSNLYGPARHKAKQQGLIQWLCSGAMQRTAVNLYVSMDTMRDYLFVEDAARLVWSLLRESDSRTGAAIHLLASGKSHTIAEVVATVENVTHRRVPLAMGTHASSSKQVLDLRFTSTLTLSQSAGLTPLPVGIRRVFDSLLGGVA